MIGQKRVLLATGIAGLLALVGFTSAPSASAGNGNVQHVPVTICHATGNPGHWVRQTVDDDSILNDQHEALGNGHAVHQDGRDIIPPFTTTDGFNYPGHNWDADGQAIWNNGCAIPTVKITAPEPVVTPPTCMSDGSVQWPAFEHGNWTNVTGTGPGTQSATPVADDGYELTNPGKVTVDVGSKLDGNADQCAVKNATAKVNVTTPDCSNAAVATVVVEHASLEGTLDQTPGTHTATFKADAGSRFADGSKELTVDYTIPDQPTGDDCASVVQPVSPTVRQDECTGPGTSGGFGVMLANGPEGVSYSFDLNSLVVTATAIATDKFSASLPAGWTLVDDHHATYQVIRTSPGDCLAGATPVAFALKAPTCATDGSLVIPEQPAGVEVTPKAGTYGPGTYSVVYSAKDGSQLSNNPSATVEVKSATGYQHSDSSASCYVHVVGHHTPPPPNGVPETGASYALVSNNGMGQLLIGAGFGAMLLLGGSTVFTRRRRLAVETVGRHRK